jgi:hypothetical protein
VKIGLALLLALAVSQAPAPVAGRVIDSETKAPIAGARMLLAPAEGRVADALVVTTTGAGTFAFPAVPAGTYRLFAVHDDYLRGSSSGTVVVPAVPITMALVPTGVISGHVLGEFGDPAERVFVRALGADGSTVASTQTNDLGEYRLFGLAPGTVIMSAQRYTAPRLDPNLQLGGRAIGPSYVVPTPPCADCMGEGQGMSSVASLTRTGAFIDPRALSGRTSIAVYYPGGSERAGARPIEITPGARIDGIDLQLVLK